MTVSNIYQNNIFGFVKAARFDYLKHLNKGGEEIAVLVQPYQPNGIIQVRDSGLGSCPKKNALERSDFPPTHPGLAELSLNDLHRMRSGTTSEKDWLSTLYFYDYVNFNATGTVFGPWEVKVGVYINDAYTSGRIDAMLDISPEHPAIRLRGRDYRTVIVEFKRTDGNLKKTYLYQLCNYLAKHGNQMPQTDNHALGKLILDHRHSIEEYTVVPVCNEYNEIELWRVYNEFGIIIETITLDDLNNEIFNQHKWLKMVLEQGNIRVTPDGIESPLHSWQCHQDWIKSRGTARFRCPYAGYCWGIESEEFEVENEKDGRRIVARIVTADNGDTFRLEEKEKE